MDNLDESSTAVQEEQIKEKHKSEKNRPTEKAFDIPGVTKIIISPLSQKALECRVGKDITSQHPWIYIAKDNLIASDKKVSEFTLIQDELLKFPRKEILLGYIPDENREYDEFYVCLTEPAEHAVNKVLSQFQKDMQEKLNRAIVKTPKSWDSNGSEPEVEQLMNLSNRSLMMFEIDSRYPIMFSKRKFRLRLAEDQRDAYMELLPGRTIYSNVFRKLIDTSAQASCEKMTHEAQTNFAYPKTAWTQYEYAYNVVDLETDEHEQNMLFTSKLSAVLEMVYLNRNFNLYKTDYGNLIKNPNLSIITIKESLKEYMTFSNLPLHRGKFISSVDWNLFLEGIVAISYSQEPSHYSTKLCHDKIASAVYEIPQVLVWSFEDDLYPKLVLETKRAVGVLSFCSFNENILLGGCVNGQLVLWNLEDKLKDAKESIASDARTFIYSQMHWSLKHRIQTVHASAISSLKQSHTDKITSFNWLPSGVQISKFGHFTDEQRDGGGLQFASSSLDGCIIFWDVCFDIRRSSRILDTFQSRKTTNFSVFIKPLFKVSVCLPGLPKYFGLTSVLLQAISVSSPENELPKCDTAKQFTAVTSEGQFISASWDGVEIDPYETTTLLHKETAKINNVSKYHDGPVLTLSKSPFFPDVLLTIGGKVFCIWKSDLTDRPLLWRRCVSRYTHGVWDNLQSSILRLSRSDGYLESWNFKIKSNSYVEILAISDCSLNGTSVHPFKVPKNVLGTVNEKGVFRMLTIPSEKEEDDEDISESYKIFENNLQSKKQYQKWNRKWQDKCKAQTKLPKESTRKFDTPFSRPLSVPKNVQRLSEQKRLSKEKDRLIDILLTNKHLNKKDLEEQRQPLLEAAKKTQNRKLKQKQHLYNAEKTFNHTVAVMFPEVIEPKPLKPVSPYSLEKNQFDSAAIFENYQQVAKETKLFIDEHPYTGTLNWLKVICEGKERRTFLDYNYEKYNHRCRFKSEKEKQERERQEAVKSKTFASTTMLHSVLQTKKAKRFVKSDDVKSNL